MKTINIPKYNYISLVSQKEEVAGSCEVARTAKELNSFAQTFTVSQDFTLANIIIKIDNPVEQASGEIQVELVTTSNDIPTTQRLGITFIPTNAIGSMQEISLDFGSIRLSAGMYALVFTPVMLEVGKVIGFISYFGTGTNIYPDGALLFKVGGVWQHNDPDRDADSESPIGSDPADLYFLINKFEPLSFSVLSFKQIAPNTLRVYVTEQDTQITRIADISLS
jgi:hypothetical protein